MPNNIIKSFAKKTNKSEEEIEKSWNKAKEIAKDEYPDVKETDEHFFKIVVGILKKMLSIVDEDGGTVSGDVATFSPKVGKIQRRYESLQNKIKNLLSEAYDDSLNHKSFIITSKLPKDTTRKREYYVVDVLQRKNKTFIYFMNDKKQKVRLTPDDIKIIGKKPSLPRDYIKGPMDGAGLYWKKDNL